MRIKRNTAPHTIERTHRKKRRIKKGRKGGREKKDDQCDEGRKEIIKRRNVLTMLNDVNQ